MMKWNDMMTEFISKWSEVGENACVDSDEMPGHGLVVVEADDEPMGLHCIIFLVLYKLDLFHNQSCF